MTAPGPMRLPLLMLALLLVAPLGACSTFERDWTAPASLAAVYDAGPFSAIAGLEGRWAGIWTSTKSGHSGTLRCIITPASPQVAKEPITAKPEAMPPTAEPAAAAPEDAAAPATTDASGPSDGTDGTGPFLARFHAVFWGTFEFEYDLVMNAHQEGDTYRFSSEADLGWLAGGRYVYEGTVDGDEFRATYRCKGDHGTFEMKRLR